MAVDPTVADQTAAQFWLGVGLLCLAFAGAAVLALRLRYSGLTDREADIVVQVQRQLASQSPGTVRISPSDSFEDRRSDIRRAFDVTGRADDSVGLRDAGQELWSEVFEAIRPYVEHVPPTARRFAALSILIAVFGALALAADTIRDALAYTPSGGSIQQWPGLALSESVAAVNLAHEWVSNLPVIGVLADLAYAFAVLAIEWAYNHWWLFAIALAGIAATVFYFDRRGADSVTIPLPQPADLLRRLAKLAAVGWVVMVIAIGVARVAASPAVGVRAGAAVVIALGVVATVAALWSVYWWVANIRALFWTAVSGGTRLRFLARLVGLAVAVVVGPLIPLWIGVGLSKLPSVVAAWMRAHISVQLLTAIVVAAVLGWLVYAARDAKDSVTAGIIETVSRRGWQAAVFGRGLPVGVIAIVYLLALGTGQGAVLAAAVALVAGSVALLLWRLVLRFRERVALLPEGSRESPLVVVHAYHLETDAGTQWVARVNNDLVAHETREGAVDAVIERAAECFADREARPTVGTAHADALREDGVVDVEATRSRLQSEARRLIEGQTLRKGSVEEASLRERLLREVPAEIADAELASMPNRGRSRVVKRGDQLVPA